MTVSDEVTAADIARIAGVGRAAVSNWRRRYPDFPRPVGGPPNSPTFSLAAVETWLASNGRSVTPAGSSVVTDTALPRAMAALLPPLAAGTVLDPASGDGARLAAAEARFGPTLRYVGGDPDPARSDPTPPDLVGSVDAVVSTALAADLPSGITTWEFAPPARGDQPLGWVQLCLAALRPGGVAVVAVPFAAAVRASGRRIRAELLRAGVLTHVVGLPEKIRVPGAAGPWQLWMLARPTGRPAYTLRMADLGGLAPDGLPQTPEAWHAVFADPERTRDLPAIELLDEEVLLIPTAHVAVRPRDLAPEYDALRHRYREARRRLAEAAPEFRPADDAGARPLVSVTDLARSGVVTFVDRDAIRPGDVIVPARTDGFEAFVAGPVAGSDDPPASAGSVLRCDPQALDPYFLACFLRAEANRRQAAGTSGGTFRLDLRRTRVPRMTLADQRRYGEAFRRLMAFTGAADELASTAAAATRTALDGLTAGTFDPEPHGKRAETT